jgi:GTP-binding protein
MADLPGLIEGAHKGVGLGDEFLRHVERTRVLVHLVEMEPHTHQAPAEAYRTIRAELAAYSRELAAKPELVVLTKTDLLPGDDSPRRQFSKAIGKPVLAISSATGTGLARLVKAILDVLDELNARKVPPPEMPPVLPPHLRPPEAATPEAPEAEPGPPPKLAAAKKDFTPESTENRVRRRDKKPKRNKEPKRDKKPKKDKENKR